jgi:DHA2 family multidrug resistance protein
MPGGIATGVSAIVSGRLLNGARQMVHPRVLIVIGLVLYISSMWDLGHLTTLSGEPDTRIALILRGAGLGLLFTPINLAAFNTLKGIEIAQGASMLNLMRQLGGSFGIALLGTYITRMNSTHYNFLAANIRQGSVAFQQRLNMLTGAFAAKGHDLASARQMALQVISGTVQRQSMTMSFNDAFLLIGLCMVAVSPLILLLRRSASAPKAEMGH